jgi:hypothetical protein
MIVKKTKQLGIFKRGINLYIPTRKSSRAPINTSGSVLFTTSPSQYLSVPNNVAFTQNQAFTIETWFYPTNITGGYIWAMNEPNFLTVKYASSGKFQIDMSWVGLPPGYSTLNTTYAINNWYHVALTWNGTNGALWINGAQESTFTGAGATVALGKAFYIGQYQDESQPTPLGNLSNFRVVKGVAVYTGVFTVPTAPLTDTQSAGTNISAITVGQTQLLLNTVFGANFLVDSSTNAFTVTNNGAVTSSVLNPF